MFQLWRNKNGNAGFSLIETMVAVTIASMVLASFSVAVALSMRSYQSAELSFKASQMAEEAMEMGINKTVNNINCVWEDECPISNWQQDLIGDFEVDVDHPEDTKPGNNFSDFASPGRYLCVTDEGKYGYCAGGKKMAGNFVRELQIISLGPNEVDIRASVSWDSPVGTRRSFTIEEAIFGGL